MRKSKKRILALILACVCALSALALAACGQSQTSSSASSESNSKSFATQPSESEEEKAVELSTDPFYVLIIGDDTRIGTQGLAEESYADGNARSDTTMLARIDPKNYLVTFITVPRDTQDATAERVSKLNETYQEGGYNALKGGEAPLDNWEAYEKGGAEELVAHVEALTGVKVKYYVDSTFVQFQKLIDAMGGIHASVPIDESQTDIVGGEKITFPAGEQDLDGVQALVFARERHKYKKLGNEEAYRQTNDRYIAQLMVQKILSDPAKVASLTEKLAGGLETNWPTDELVAYAEDFAEHAGELSFISGTGPYTGGIEDSTQLWMATRDEDLWAQIIEVVDAGGDPNTVLPAPSSL